MIDLKVLRDNANKVVGLTVSGDGTTETKEFCLSFLLALKKGEAGITFSETEITFEHPKCVYEKVYKVSCPPEEILELQKIIHPANDKLKAESSLAWAGSFTLRAN